jgi:hypothetical protein
MRRFMKIVRIAATLAGVAATVSLAAQPIVASADYNHTRPALWYAPGYINVDQHWKESPPGGVPWYSEVIWASNASTNFWSTDLTFSGESHAYWWGSHPWCASKIDLNDTFKVSGVAVSASVGYPASVGLSVSASGDQASFNTANAVCNAYFDQVQHNYSGIEFVAWDISTMTQTDCGVFTFSYQANHRCVSGWDWVNP